MAALRRVALIIDTAGAYGRQVISGIMRYLDEHGPWDIYLETGTAEHPAGILRWSGDGILARVRSPAMAEALARIDVPKVVLNPVAPAPHLRSPVAVAAVPDRWADCTLAIEHFRERGFRQVAFCCDVSGADHGRFDPAQAAAAEAGLAFWSYRDTEPRTWDAYQRRLVEWLRGLPKPIGIVCANDNCGREVLDAAKLAALHVPEELAVLGSDDDELLCNLSTPKLSSIRVAAGEIGFRSAELLAELMAGGTPPEKPILLPPWGLIARQSTDVLAIDDPEVVEALTLIRMRAIHGLDVGEILKTVPISRRALERRFKKWIGRNPQEEIRKVQIREVQRLLGTTNLKLHEVARRTGFPTAARLAQAYRAATEGTPSAYRRSAWLGREP